MVRYRPDEERRELKLYVPVTTDEKAAVVKAAAEAQLSLANFVRTALFQALREAK